MVGARRIEGKRYRESIAVTVLEQMAQWLAARTNQPLSSTSRERIAIHLLDTVGAWIAGRGTEEGAMLAQVKSAPRTAFPLFSDDPRDRIALGCATVRLTEIDDIHMASCVTPSSVVVPTALIFAAAQSRQPDPQVFCAALWAGYEVMTRLGAAINGPSIVYQGIWPTYFAAPMGAAAVTARLLGLDAAKTADALGIALTVTSGAPGGPSPFPPRWLLLGLAARAGCSSALAAAEGYTSDQTLLNGDWMIQTHGIRCDVSALSPVAQDADAIAALSLKPYCAAKQCIAPVEAFRDLLDQGISPDDIASLRVAVPPAYATMISHRHAASGRVPRITSAAYNIALAAYEPEGLGDVTRPSRTGNSRVATFMERVEVTPDRELSRYYPVCWPARVDAKLQSGPTVSSLVLDAPGDPSRAFDVGYVREKFHRYADQAIGRAAADELASACLAAIENQKALSTVVDWANA